MSSHRPRPAAALALAASALLAAAPAVSAAPAPQAHVLVAPARTAISVTTPWGHAGTPNEDESRPALSMVKLLMADWVLNQGDGSEYDRAMCERMIRFSDDGAAGAMWAKYGAVTIASPAAFYGLDSTWAGGTWGTSRTSAEDLVRFLEAKRVGDPSSPVLRWMREAAPVAADGTRQDWGTGTYADVAGNKWGWSGYGPQVVASASFGRDFSVSAITYGSPGTQTADVHGALADVPAAPVPVGGSLSTAGLPPQLADPLTAADRAVSDALASVQAGSAGVQQSVSAALGLPNG